MADNKTKTRRVSGISFDDVKSTSVLKFEPKDAIKEGPAKGLFEAALAEVSIRKDQYGVEAKVFAGCEVPKLVFRFTSLDDNKELVKSAWDTITPAEYSEDTAIGAENGWKTSNIVSKIKYYLETYLSTIGKTISDLKAIPSSDGYNWKEDAELCLPFYQDGKFVAMSEEEVLAEYERMFTAIVDIFNGVPFATNNETPTPIFKNKGKLIPAYILLYASIFTNGGWKDSDKNGTLIVPSLVNSGFIEFKKGNAAPVKLSFNTEKYSLTKMKKTAVAPPQGGMMTPGVNPNMNTSMPPMAANVQTMNTGIEPW